MVMPRKTLLGKKKTKSRVFLKCFVLKVFVEGKSL